MEKGKYLTSEEKGQLKDMVLRNDMHVYSLLEKFEQQFSFEILVDEAKKLLEDQSKPKY